MRKSTLVFSLLFGRAVLAQSAAPPQLGDRSIDAWIGFSANSRVGDFDLPRRQLLLIGVRAEWVIETLGPLALATTSDIVPVAVVTHTPAFVTREVQAPNGAVIQVRDETGNRDVFGAGAVPFGFKLYLAATHGIRLYGAAGAGALWFTREMPLPDARRFNLSFEGGGGLEFVRAKGHSMVLGYKFHHLSNANSAAVNPGLDSSVFYLGVSRAR
jgi:hypothetical protein